MLDGARSSTSNLSEGIRPLPPTPKYRGLLMTLLGAPLRAWSPPGGLPSTPQLLDFIAFGFFWVDAAFGNILSSIVLNSHFGKRPVARDITIFGSHFLPHVTEHVDSY